MSRVNRCAITGIGIITPIGCGQSAVQRALLAGDSAFGVMQRSGRQKGSSAFLGAEIANFEESDFVSRKVPRSASWTSQVTVATVSEAWTDAQLGDLDPERIGLIVGGSNLQQREIVATHDAFADRFEYLRPMYAQMFMDTDICAICTEQFGIRGIACTVGGASASGHLAIVQAIQAVSSKQVDVCIAVGALMDISYWECQGFRALGAMGSDRFAKEPGYACRPFDRWQDGFIYGENCGAVVIERGGRVRRKPYAMVRGWSYLQAGARTPHPSLDCEVSAIKAALKMAKLNPSEIDYINPHGTGSPIGDRVELRALKECGLAGAYINATKSILGHGLSAAGTVEVVATLLQMRAGQLHPSKNLVEPIDASFSWITARSFEHRTRNALNLSFGFGGVSSAICLSDWNETESLSC
jgi:malonyl-ACP decarboxylase